MANLEIPKGKSVPKYGGKQTSGKVRHSRVGKTYGSDTITGAPKGR